MADSIVGIDLGTSNSAVAHCDASGQPRVLADGAGAKIHPSVVSFHPNGSVIIGAEAKQRKVLDPRNTVFSAKRLIGRSYRSSQVQTAMERMPYAIKEGPNQQPLIGTRAGEFSIPEISALILDNLHNIAKEALRNDASQAVITVPANFTEAQRSATATAGAIAGLTVVRVLNEPTAAALAYGHQRRLNQTIAVYDFGGGTFDVTVLRLSDQVFEVLGTAGDSFLGGDDIDERVVDQLVDAFLAEHRVDLRDNQIAMMRLRAVAEQTKIELSRRQKALIRVDELAYGAGGVPLHMQCELSRAELVARVTDVIDRTFPVCQEALKMAGLTTAKLYGVVRVSGTTKMPSVRDRVSEFFGRLPRTDVHPEEAVALGAALQAQSLERLLGGRPATSPPVRAMAVPDREIDNDESRIHARPGSARMTTEPLPAAALPPARTTAPRLTSAGGAVDHFPVAGSAAPGGSAIARITRPAGTPPVTAPLPSQGRPPSVPTMRGPAVGATSPSLPPINMPLVPGLDAALDVQTNPTIETPLYEDAALRRSTRPATVPPVMPRPRSLAPSVADVTPRGLGIATVGGYCEGLILRNARIPSETKRSFSTAVDLQRSVRIVICQGEAKRIEGNTVLGDLVLDGLEPRPRGETAIEVTFALDASGILSVSARDTRSGKIQHATLNVIGAMAGAEVDAARSRLQQLR